MKKKHDFRESDKTKYSKKVTPSSENLKIKSFFEDNLDNLNLPINLLKETGSVNILTVSSNQSNKITSSNNASCNNIIIDDAKLEKEVKEDKKLNQLSLINKNLAPTTKIQIANHRDHILTITFPFILEVPLGIYAQKLNSANVKSLLSKKYPESDFSSVEVVKKEYTSDQCIDLSIGNEVIGYLSKDISKLLHSSLKFDILQHNLIVDNNKLNTFIIVSFDTKHEKFAHIKTEDNFDSYYKISNSNFIPIECIKSINNLTGTNYFIKPDSVGANLKDYINKNLLNDLDYNTDSDENKTTFNQFILMNISNILKISLNYSFLFSETELNKMSRFLSLENYEKEIVSKFLTRSSFWIRKSNIAKNTEGIENETFNKIIKEGLLTNINIILTNYPDNNIEENNKCKTELFDFLYYLNHEDLKNVTKELSKLTKYNKKIEDSNKYVDEIFINNSFYRLDYYMDFKTLKKINVEISKEISNFNFENRIVNTNESLLNNKFINGKANKNKHNSKYITTFLNSTNYKKVKFSKSNFSQKMAIICGIVKTIDCFLTDKSHSVMDNFITNKNKTTSNDKKEKILNILSNYEMYSLDRIFAKTFDIASRLFFFYSDYKDVNHLSKEFYGMENFEDFKCFVNYSKDFVEGKQIDEYLKPIFMIEHNYKLYDNLYQLKTAYGINNLYFNNNTLNFCVVKNFVFLLMFLNNKSLFNLIYQNSFDQEFNFSDEYSQFTDKTKMNEILEQIENSQDSHNRLINYLIENKIPNVNVSFVTKFTHGHVSSELLNYFGECCEKLKRYNLAAIIYLFLLNDIYLYKKRGLWWNRLIIIYNKYIKNKSVSVKLLNIAINDPHVKSGDLVKLKQYYDKFEKEKINIKSKKGHSKMRAESKEYLEELDTDVNGLKECEVYDEKLISDIKRVINSDSIYQKESGRRLYSLGNKIGTVEEFALIYYEDNFEFYGIHGENIILPALYNIFMWDIIFYDRIPYTFQSPYQFFPLDFFYEDFYKNRSNLILERIQKISCFSYKDLEDTFEHVFTKKKNYKCAFINWENILNSKEVLLKIAVAISPLKLSQIFLEFTKNLKFMIKGMPDLFLWKETVVYVNNVRTTKVIEGSALIVEVKSKNDKLSDYQKYWLSFLSKCDQKVEVLHILE